jgi:hypothetical protein
MHFCQKWLLISGLVQLPFDALLIVIFVADYIFQLLMFHLNEVVGCLHLGMRVVTLFPQIKVQRV